MLLEVKCGSLNLKIEVDPSDVMSQCDQADSTSSTKKPATVGELRKVIQEKANLNSDLKLIYKGKFLGMNVDEPLSNYRFSDMDKIVALGAKKAEDPGYASLVWFEKKNIFPFISSFNQIANDLAELEKNFLDGKILQECLSKMEKRIRSFGETGTRHMEAIDSLQIYDDSTDEEQKKRSREKRKQLIESIDDLLNKNDKHIFRLKDYRFKIEHP